MVAEVRLGDWRDVLPGTYDPARAIVITDPPFGIARESFIDTRPMAEHVAELLDLLPARRHVIRMMPASLGAVRAPRRICAEIAAYRAGTARPGTVMHAWIAWAIYGRLAIDGPRRGVRRDWCLVGALDDPPGMGRARVRHRGLTPWRAADWAVTAWSEAGYLIVDPFAGLGTIGLRAAAHGHDYLGAEIDPEYAAVAAAQLVPVPSLGL